MTEELTIPLTLHTILESVAYLLQSFLKQGGERPCFIMSKESYELIMWRCGTSSDNIEWKKPLTLLDHPVKLNENIPKGYIYITTSDPPTSDPE